MDIKTKCEIIEEFVRDHIDDYPLDSDDILTFIEYNDLGIPLAQAIAYDLVELKSEAISLIEETWSNLCEILGIDKDGEYENIADCLDDEDDL